MENPMKARVLARLDALGLKPTSDAAKGRMVAVGLSETYLNEFLTGKKKSFSQSKIPLVAAALDCDPAFLLGQSDIARAGTSGGPDSRGPGVTIVGVCEAGAWRSEQPDLGAPVLIHADSRHPENKQVAYIVRGNHAAGLGITDGSVVVVFQEPHVRHGDPVVIRSVRSGGETETRIAVVDETMQSQISKKDVEVVGIITLCLKTF